jgi:hypothetical protein
MLIYGSGFIAVYLILSLLYLRALALRARLELDRIEVFDTEYKLVAHLICMGIGLLSVVLAFAWSPAAAGWTYMVLPLAMSANGFAWGARRERLEEALAKESRGGTEASDPVAEGEIE